MREDAVAFRIDFGLKFYEAMLRASEAEDVTVAHFIRSAIQERLEKEHGIKESTGINSRSRNGKHRKRNPLKNVAIQKTLLPEKAKSVTE